MTARRVVFNMRDERPVWAPPAWVASRLREALPAGCELVDVAAAVSGRGDGGGVSPAALAAVRGAEIYFGLGLPRELLLAALEQPARLRWVHSGAAGVASLLHAELAAAGVLLTNSAGVHGPAIAETVLGMMLHFARGFDHATRAQQRASWDATPFESGTGSVRELAGATLGIVGYGGIGRALAARAQALGMDIVALRRGTAEDPARQRWREAAPVAVHAPEVRLLAGRDALAGLLDESDFIALTAPSTAETRGMIGARELQRMRSGAVLVNVGRGDLIDEAALIEALRSRRLRGAALDVFATEPLPDDSPLWHLDNILITPHVSGTTPRFWERELDLMLHNLRSYFTGEPLLNVVDTAAGY